MSATEEAATHTGRSRGLWTGLAVVALLAALPLAVWLDLRNLADLSLRRQANDLNSVITGASAARPWSPACCPLRARRR